MQMRVFSIPMEGDEAAEEACNAFLRAHKVLAVDKHPVVVQGRQFWSVCVEYLPRRHGEPMPGRSASAPAMDRPRTDYRELLTTEQFARFCKLRDLRKRLAEQDASPVYMVLTNAQLAEIARKVPKTKSALGAIDGVGPAKVERFGASLLELLLTLPDAETGTGDDAHGSDSLVAAAQSDTASTQRSEPVVAIAGPTVG
jgi:superfamily II DNA helicase RecQ